MNNGNGIVVGAVALLAVLGLDATLPRALAADAAADTAPMNWHHGHGGPNGGGAMGRGAEGAMMQVLHGLNLSDAQKQQIHTLIRTAHNQWQAAEGSDASDLAALGNPADPNHAAAVQSAKTRAAQRIQDWSDLDQQIYGVLTTDQRARLPQLLADLQSRIAARRNEWRAQQGATP